MEFSLLLLIFDFSCLRMCSFKNLFDESFLLHFVQMISGFSRWYFRICLSNSFFSPKCMIAFFTMNVKLF